MNDLESGLPQPNEAFHDFQQPDESEPPELVPEVRLTDDVFGDFKYKVGKVPLLNAEQEVQLAMQIEAGLFASKLLEIPPSERSVVATEDELRILADSGKEAHDHLIEANIRLVISNARRYVHPGASLEDLTDIGLDGLFRAVEKFDYTKGIKFSTYATKWILRELKANAQNLGRNIRLPRDTIVEVMAYKKAKRELESREAYTVEKLAEEMDVSVDRVRMIGQWSMRTVSLNLTFGDQLDTSLSDLIEDDNEVNQEKLNEFKDLQNQIFRALDLLEKEEAIVLAMNYDLDGNGYRLLKEIAAYLGFSESKVRYLKSRGLAKLRNIDTGLEDYWRQEWVS